MKVVENICCDKPKEITYPRLMIGNASKIVYLLTDANTGIVIKSSPTHTSYPIGKLCQTLMVSSLREYTGTITLSND